MDAMADVCHGIYRIFIRYPLPTADPADKTAAAVRIWLSGHLYDLRRDHEPGGTVYERISIQLERTACDLYLRCSGRSGACKLNLLVFVDRGEAAAGETAEDQGEVWVAVGKSKNSQWELYYRVLQF